MNFCMVRYIFQLHNVHGGLIGGADSGGAQLSPSDGGHTRDAAMGEYNTHTTQYSLVLGSIAILKID